MSRKNEHMFEEVISEIECDVIVRMSSIKERIVRAKVKSIEKATPRVVEPERV